MLLDKGATFLRKSLTFMSQFLNVWNVTSDIPETCIYVLLGIHKTDKGMKHSHKVKISAKETRNLDK